MGGRGNCPICCRVPWPRSHFQKTIAVGNKGLGGFVSSESRAVCWPHRIVAAASRVSPLPCAGVRRAPHRQASRVPVSLLREPVIVSACRLARLPFSGKGTFGRSGGRDRLNCRSECRLPPEAPLALLRRGWGAAQRLSSLAPEGAAAPALRRPSGHFRGQRPELGIFTP